MLAEGNLKQQQQLRQDAPLSFSFPPSHPSSGKPGESGEQTQTCTRHTAPAPQDRILTMTSGNDETCKLGRWSEHIFKIESEIETLI